MKQKRKVMKEIEISESEIMGVSYFIVENLKHKDIFIENIFYDISEESKDSTILTNYIEENYEVSKKYIIEFIKFRQQQLSNNKISYQDLSKQFSNTNNKIVTIIKYRLMRVVYELVDDFYSLEKSNKKIVLSNGEKFFTNKIEIKKRKEEILERERELLERERDKERDIDNEIKKLTSNQIEIETFDTLNYIINEMKNDRLFFEEFDNDVGSWSEPVMFFINSHKRIVNEFILYLILFNNKYDNLDRDTFKYKFYDELKEIFNDLAFGNTWSEDEDYVLEVKGESMTKSDVILESIYHLTVEYSLFSPFERESIKCFGKNFFSGEKYNTPEFRELS